MQVARLVPEVGFGVRAPIRAHSIGGKQVGQDVSFLAMSLIGAILSFVGLTAFLPAGTYRKLFGYVWPIDSLESRDKALQRRLAGAVITAIGLTALQAGVMALLENLR